VVAATGPAAGVVVAGVVGSSAGAGFVVAMMLFLCFGLDRP
jgi:hypothetical protein